MNIWHVNDYPGLLVHWRYQKGWQKSFQLSLDGQVLQVSTTKYLPGISWRTYFPFAFANYSYKKHDNEEKNTYKVLVNRIFLYKESLNVPGKKWDILSVYWSHFTWWQCKEKLTVHRMSKNFLNMVFILIFRTLACLWCAGPSEGILRFMELWRLRAMGIPREEWEPSNVRI